MPIQRIFLGAQQPALSAAGEYLLNRFRSGERFDLSNTIIVVPGRRAERRLLEILIDLAQKNSLLLEPPDIVTEGAFPERLYEPKRPFAPLLVQQLVWTEALKSVPRDQLVAIVPHPPEEKDEPRWMDLGDLLRRQHTELAADGLHFGDVAQKGITLAGFTEQRRWQAMRAIQKQYHLILDNLELWDVQTARLIAIEKEEIHTNKEIVLLAAVDLNASLRKMLDRVSGQTAALIHGPAEWSDRFDQYGCVSPSSWSEAKIDINDRLLHQVDKPSDQASEVLRFLAALNGRYPADEITIGAPDESLAVQIGRSLTQHELETRWINEKLISATSPFRLLDATAAFVQSQSLSDFSALVRHSDLYELLSETISSGDFLSQLDSFRLDRLDSIVDQKRLNKEETYPQVKELHEVIDRLTAGLRSSPKPLSQWTQPIKKLLMAVYGCNMLDRDDAVDRCTLAACREISQSLAGHATIPPSLEPKVSAAEAIRMTLDPLRSTAVPPPSKEGAIEILGWLELVLDDAPVLILTGLNEGVVPTSINSDPFLPNRLRTHLGLTDNARRYARDAYALSALLMTRQKISLILGRRNLAGDPLTPSRLLFAADGKVVAQRSVSFFATPSEVTSPREMTIAKSNPTNQPRQLALHPPQPEPLAEPITEMRVTQFRSYLACPYRFYLAHVLKLRGLDDSSEELDPGAFGSLLHYTLEKFGNSSEKDSSDSDEIFAMLSNCLDRLALRRYGENRRAAVSIQIEQMRLRLRAFSTWQAKRSSEGWRIEYTEKDREQLQATMEVDGQGFQLRGRIDRIDVHPKEGRVIFDYKTGDSAKTPAKSHQQKDGWIDLQLPLYRHLAASLKIDLSRLKLGYIVLPKDLSQTGDRIAKWEEEDLQHADQTAMDVIRKVRRELFLPKADPPPAFSEEFAAICQDRIYGSWTAEDPAQETA